MSRLVDELCADPGAVFEMEAVLPSGNTMIGTIGPLVGDKVCSQIHFKNNPASDSDIQMARLVVDKAMGQEPEFVSVSRTPAERKSAQRDKVRFLGGGQG